MRRSDQLCQCTFVIPIILTPMTNTNQFVQLFSHDYGSTLVTPSIAAHITRLTIVFIKDVAAGNIALSKPGETFSQATMSSATNWVSQVSQTRSKRCRSMNECALTEGRADVEDANGLAGLRHMDYLVINGGKGLERYVVVAGATKSFNGQIMMGLSIS